MKLCVREGSDSKTEVYCISFFTPSEPNNCLCYLDLCWRVATGELVEVALNVKMT